MRTNKNRFIEKSLLGALSFFTDSVFAEVYASKKGILQSLDPRVKILLCAAFVIAVLFMKSIIPILFLYSLVLIFAILSQVNLVYFLKRTWIFIPLFSLFIAIPAIFSVFSPGEVVFSFRLFGATLSITRQGVGASSLFVARVITSVSIVVLLSLTTRQASLLHALRVFKIPPIFIMTISMCYRYIYSRE